MFCTNGKPQHLVHVRDVTEYGCSFPNCYWVPQFPRCHVHSEMYIACIAAGVMHARLQMQDVERSWCHNTRQLPPDGSCRTDASWCDNILAACPIRIRNLTRLRIDKPIAAMM